MKKIAGLLFIALLLSGCALFTDSQTPEQKAYVAGQLAGSVYMDAKNVQPAQVTLAAQVSYRILTIVTAQGSTNELEAVIGREVAKVAAGVDSAVLQVLVKDQVNAAMFKILKYCDMNAWDSDRMNMLIQFRRGVNDTLVQFGE
jgi:uncharacterized protein YceK